MGISVASTNILPVTTDLTVASGATLDAYEVNQTVASLSGPSGSSVKLTNSTLNVAGSTSTTFGGVISGNGNLTRSGTGTLTLTGANTHSGGTTVTGGTLLANNTSGSATGTGPVIVQSGATLGGIGSIITTGLTVLAGGILTPGSSPETLTVTGPVTLTPGSIFGTELAIGGSAAPGNGSIGTDRLIVNGSINITDALLTGVWGGTPGNLFFGTLNANNMLWIIENDGVDPLNGIFANSSPAPGYASLFGGVTPHLASIGGVTFALFYQSQADNFSLAGLTGGNDLLLVAVPEPGRVFLGALALLPMVLRRRRS
jgi:autotransporter-associated beta strand protein